MGSSLISTRSGAAALALVAATGGGAWAQNAATPQTIPGLDHFSLPGTPTPVPTPMPTVSPTAAAPRAPARTPAAATPESRVPVARSIPAPRPVPIASPTPVPTPAPTAKPPIASPAPVATFSPSPVAPQAQEPGSSLPWWLAAGGVAALLVVGMAAWLVRRRRGRDAIAEEDAPPVSAPAPIPPPAPTPPAPILSPTPPAKATLEIALHPRRAGTNLTSAAIEYDVIVTNAGAAPATAIRIDVRLLSAGAQQDAVIAALLAAPIAHPATAPFDLPAGASASLGGKALLPRESVSLIDGERALFVPLVTVNVVHDAGQTARTFLIGIDRGAGAKPAPFRRDEIRMHDRLAALTYTIAIDR